MSSSKTLYCTAVLLIVLAGPTNVAGASSLVIAVADLTNPVAVGEEARLAIDTELGALCVGRAWSEANSNQRVRLSGKTVDDKGHAGWSWQIPKTAATGKWSINLQCATQNKQGRISATFAVR